MSLKSTRIPYLLNLLSKPSVPVFIKTTFLQDVLIRAYDPPLPESKVKWLRPKKSLKPKERRDLKEILNNFYKKTPSKKQKNKLIDEALQIVSYEVTPSRPAQILRSNRKTSLWILRSLYNAIITGGKTGLRTILSIVRIYWDWFIADPISWALIQWIALYIIDTQFGGLPKWASDLFWKGTAVGRDTMIDLIKLVASYVIRQFPGGRFVVGN